MSEFDKGLMRIMFLGLIMGLMVRVGLMQHWWTADTVALFGAVAFTLVVLLCLTAGPDL